MQLLQNGVMRLPFDTAAADTVRALPLMKLESQRLTAVVTQALRGHSLYSEVSELR